VPPVVAKGKCTAAPSCPGGFVIITSRWRQRARIRAPREPETISVAVARAMHEALDAMGSIREAGCGLRAQLEADGFSPAAAEYLAVRFIHQCLKHMKLTVSVNIGNEPDDDPRVKSGQS
jgi:hypothetical protein